MSKIMRSTVMVWVHAARPRTLPLAFSSSLMGSFAALDHGRFKWPVLIMALITTLFLQILSNLANDYGDSVNGADNESRIGPARAVQSGAIGASQMKAGILVTALLALTSGLLLIGTGPGFNNWQVWLFFVVAGLGAIAAAVLYTAGARPYGYIGMGDFFVFLFFGVVAVAGTCYLHTGSLTPAIALPAVALGFLSTAVLNLNNMRDMHNDRLSGKLTVVVRMGFKKAKIYHAGLISMALVALLLWTALHYNSPWQFIYVIVFPVFILHLRQVFSTRDHAALDPLLKRLALSTFFLVVLFGAGSALSVC